MLLYVMDNFKISSKVWQEISLNSRALPSTCSMKKRIDSINKPWQISSTPGDGIGVQVKLDEGLMDQAKILLADNKIEPK